MTHTRFVPSPFINSDLHITATDKDAKDIYTGSVKDAASALTDGVYPTNPGPDGKTTGYLVIDGETATFVPDTRTLVALGYTHDDVFARIEIDDQAGPICAQFGQPNQIEFRGENARFGDVETSFLATAHMDGTEIKAFGVSLGTGSFYPDFTNPYTEDTVREYLENLVHHIVELPEYTEAAHQGAAYERATYATHAYRRIVSAKGIPNDAFRLAAAAL